jgi:hypothetical protein
MQLKSAYLTRIQVCYLLGINPHTLYNWYRYIEKTPPQDIPEDCPGLPKYILKEDGKTKLWRGMDLHQLFDFKQWVPKGRYGKMGRTNEIYWAPEHRKNKPNQDTL